ARGSRFLHARHSSRRAHRSVARRAARMGREHAMRVLITNHALALIGGAQAYSRDLATWLLAHGHSPIVFGPDHGAAAEQMAGLGIPVTDDLEAISAVPDVIHGNSPVETMAALLRFPGTPAVFVCHGVNGLPGMPPR